MPRATRVLKAGHRHDRPLADTLILDYTQRSAQKGTATGIKGLVVEIDLHEPARLRTDDVLAGTTLRLANSAFYARGSPVTSLAGAVSRLGMKELHRLGVASTAARA